MRQIQRPFPQTTTAALSVGQPCTYTGVRTKHQCCYLSILTLLSLFRNEKKKYGALLSEQPSYINNQQMQFNVYYVFYSQRTHQQVPVALTATFRVSSTQYTTPSTHYLHAGSKLATLLHQAPLRTN